MSEQEIHRELNNLRTLGTFAGQESILALSRYFSINILVTVGGDEDNQDVITLEHDFGNFDSRIHLVWTRAGGGHYEIVPETVSDLRQETHRSMGQSNYQWNLDSPWCRKFDLNSAKTDKVHMQETVRLPETIDLTKHSEYLKTVHPYNKEKSTTNKQEIFQKNACMICRKEFHDKANLNRHLKNVHEKERNWRMPCIVPSCDLNFFHVEDLVSHLVSNHDADIQIEFKF